MKVSGRPRFWTEERLYELQRLINYDWTSDRIAAHFGKSVIAVRSAASKHRLTSMAGHALKQSRRMKSRKMTAAGRKARAVAMKRRHQDADFHNRIVTAFHAPEARRKANASRRGFSVPDEMEADYQFMRRKLGSATEAGRVLGLIEGNP